MGTERENIKPIKRSKDLLPLSRDHHNGLLLCWKIRNGINKGISFDRISSYVLYCFDNDLDKHFTEEEQYIFPLFSKDNTYRIEAEQQHDALRAIIKLLRNNPQESNTLLIDFSDQLQNHIRFEERVLFNIIEDQTDKNILHQVGQKLVNTTDCNIGWNDNFWLK